MPNKSENEKIYPLIQTEIQRYVMAHLMPQCTSEPLRFSERELARTLKVNRLTVHRAAEEMLRRGYLIQIPGRRGLFLNPDCKTSFLSEKYYGILFEDGRVPILTMQVNQILKGFFAAGQNETYIDCQFLTLTGQSYERIAMEIMSYPLHALFWFFPRPEMYPVIDLLMEKSLPLAIVNTVTDSRIVPYRTNSITIDYSAIGRMFAEKVLESGFRKVIFAGLKSPVFASFQQAMSDSKFPFSSSDFIEYTPLNHDPDKLVSLIRKRKTELVVSDGMVFHDLKKLVDLTGLSGPHFLLMPFQYVKKQAAVHPDYRLIFPDFSFDDLLTAIGNNLANRFSVDSPPTRFPNEPLIVSDFIKNQ